MSDEKRDFDKEAATWDEKPDRVKLAGDIARTIAQQVVLSTAMDVLDFGCGTGLVTLHLQPLVRSITGIDSSPGMIEVLRRKAAQRHLGNVRTLQLDPDRGEALTGAYNLVVSSMVFHHVKHVDALLKSFQKIITPGGHISIADLDLDDGQFHSDNTGVFHFGFDRAALRGVFAEAGFRNMQDTTAAEVVKPARSGAQRRFTVFLMTAQKPAT